MVFGERAGVLAAAAARDTDPGWSPSYAEPARGELADVQRRHGQGPTPGVLQSELQDVMWDKCRSVPHCVDLEDARATIRQLEKRSRTPPLRQATSSTWMCRIGSS